VRRSTPTRAGPVSTGPATPRPRAPFREVVFFAAVAAATAAVVVTVTVAGRERAPTAFHPRFAHSGLVTNEHAYSSPEDPARRRSRDWIVTSGSLFAQDGAGWTGPIDRVDPNALSSSGTDSAVFRLVSRRHNFGDVRVSFDLRVDRQGDTAATPQQSFDGVHVWVRYASPQALYAVSVLRRDGAVLVKRKTPGGPSNDGTYTTLGQVQHQLPFLRWIPVVVTVRNIGHAVAIGVSLGGAPILNVLDDNPGPQIRAGAVGLRGDNTEFHFRQFKVTGISTSVP
jgi:hypothetical protein